MLQTNIVINAKLFIFSALIFFFLFCFVFVNTGNGPLIHTGLQLLHQYMCVDGSKSNLNGVTIAEYDGVFF